MTTDFLFGGTTDVGDLTSTVLVDSSGPAPLYVYELVVLPAFGGAGEFNTGFPAIGFTGTGGYNFSEAVDAGASGNGSLAFSISDEGDGTLDWEAVGFAWAADAPITFFFESSAAPGRGDYNLPGPTAEGYAPAPLPASLLLLGSGTIVFGALRRRIARG